MGPALVWGSGTQRGDFFVFCRARLMRSLHPYARPAAARNGKATAAAAHRVLRLPGPTQERDITLAPEN